MPSIYLYQNLIKEIPVLKQSAKIKSDVWSKIPYNDKEEIEDDIFGSTPIVEITREDIFKENNTKKKIIMILMWGYPTGGRGSNISNVLTQLAKLEKTLGTIKDKNLTVNNFQNCVQQFNGVSGLGISTWSKFLYFFNVKIDSKSCLIYDHKIVKSLNRKQFNELGLKIWKQNADEYLEYINLIESLANGKNFDPAQMELFLFYFNYSYKF